MQIHGSRAVWVNYNKDPAPPKGDQGRRDAIKPGSSSEKNAYNAAALAAASALKSGKNAPAAGK